MAPQTTKKHVKVFCGRGKSLDSCQFQSSKLDKLAQNPTNDEFIHEKKKLNIIGNFLNIN